MVELSRLRQSGTATAMVAISVHSARAHHHSDHHPVAMVDGGLCIAIALLLTACIRHTRRSQLTTELHCIE